jgi:hypothetical protein
VGRPEKIAGCAWVLWVEALFFLDFLWLLKALAGSKRAFCPVSRQESDKHLRYGKESPIFL